LLYLILIYFHFQVHAFYRFQPLTAYLAVNYFDRFLSAHHFPVSLTEATVPCTPPPRPNPQHKNKYPPYFGQQKIRFCRYT